MSWGGEFDYFSYLEARHLEFARNVAHDLDLARDLSLALSLASELALASDLDLELDLTRHLELPRGLAVICGLDFQLIRDRNRARELAGNLARRLARARQLTHSLANTHDLTLIRELDVVLGRAIEKAERLCCTLSTSEPENVVTNSAVPEKKQIEPRRAARRMAEFAARVLPVAHRARYRDEYRSKLHDIAADGASGWQQVMYAVRLLNRSWKLRYELRQPAARRVPDPVGGEVVDNGPGA